MTRGADATEATETGFRLRDIALPAYGPTVVNCIGQGAVMPVLAIRAVDLGADASTAALVVAVLGVGTLLASLPAGAAVARVGERRALFVAGLVEATALVASAATHSVVGLALATATAGAAWAVFLIARQAFIIDAVPPAYRARALSTLGGSARVGVFVGPLVGAGLIHLSGLPAVFVLAAGCSVASALLALAMPDLSSESRLEQGRAGHASVWSVLRRHRRTLLTLGTAVVVISGSRSVRVGLLPLWAHHIGLSASTTSLIFGLAAGIEIVFFYPGGWLMDHHGRALVAVPVVLAVAVGCLVLPLTSTALGVAGVMALIAFGNGLGAGIVMTLGADTAPSVGRAQYLGGWRLCGDIGGTSGPLLVGALAAAVPLAVASVVVGVLGLFGSAWVGLWTHRLDVARARALSRR